MICPLVPVGRDGAGKPPLEFCQCPHGVCRSCSHRSVPSHKIKNHQSCAVPTHKCIHSYLHALESGAWSTPLDTGVYCHGGVLSRRCIVTGGVIARVSSQGCRHKGVRHMGRGHRGVVTGVYGHMGRCRRGVWFLTCCWHVDMSGSRTTFECVSTAGLYR